MNKFAVIYHSGHGHTAHIAQHVVAGASEIQPVEVQVIEA